MGKMINIVLSIEGEEILKCGHIWLDPYAPNTGRKFVFSDMHFQKDLIKHDDRIHVDITVSNKWNNFASFIQFEILVLDYDYENLSRDEWWVYGTVCDIGFMEYTQGKMDSFNTWQQGKLFDWFSLPIHSPLKLDYIGACMFYSGLSTKMIEKEVYQFDMSLVKEERDFFYLASLEFVGDRGYFGHDFYTYEDCLLELYHHHGYFHEKKIVFLNKDKIYSQEIENFYEDLKKALLKYKFIIEEK